MLVGKCLWWRVHLPMQEMCVQSLGQEDSPRKEMATCFSSWLGNPMDRGAWQATVLRVAKSRTRLSARMDTHTHTQMSALRSVFGMKVRKEWFVSLYPLQSCPWPPHSTVASRRPDRGCLLLFSVLGLFSWVRGFLWVPPSCLECCEGRTRSRGQTGQWLIPRDKLMIRFQ